MNEVYEKKKRWVRGRTFDKHIFYIMYASAFKIERQRRTNKCLYLLNLLTFQDFFRIPTLYDDGKHVENFFTQISAPPL